MAFGETINLGVLHHFCVLHLEKIDSTEILRMDSQIGSTAPLHCSALGKAMVAFLPGAERDRILSQLELTPMGPNCITVRKDLEQELKTIQDQGFAIDDEELVPGLRCVAAPVFDHTGLARYAISVSGPAMRMTDDRMDSARKHVINVCKKLSMQLKNLEM
jgi:DNA-binding IclR family transcriptional regulator